MQKEESFLTAQSAAESQTITELNRCGVIRFVLYIIPSKLIKSEKKVVPLRGEFSVQSLPFLKQFQISFLLCLVAS